jgi:hypothetical protein
VLQIFIVNYALFSGRTVRQWCRIFKYGRSSGRSSVVGDDLIQNIDQKTLLRISELSCKFPKNFTHSLLRDYHRLRYHKFCARWVPKMLTSVHKTAENGFGFNFLRAISQRWRRISQSHRTSSRSNRWWNLCFICESWNPTAVKAAVDAHTFTKHDEKV